MTVAARLSRLNTASLRHWGETVTVPSGTVQAAVDLPGIASELRQRGSTSGSRLNIDQQVQPSLLLLDADAAALREQDAVSVRGTDYLIVRLTPDGDGMTRAELMLPGAEPGPVPEWSRWR